MAGFLRRSFTSRFSSLLLSSLKDRATIFYVLAFIPLLLIAYFNAFGVIIPIFGFLLFYLKKQDLWFDERTDLLPKVFGVALMIGSFFLYFVWVPFLFSYMVFYNVTNYIVYVFGLCVMFFGLQSLRRVFSPLFLMVAASTNPFISKLMESYTSSYVVSAFTDISHGFLRALGIPVIRDSANVLTLQTRNGPLPLRIIWNCVGIDSILIFTMVLVIMLFEDASSTRTKLLWSLIGVSGTIVVNFVRVTLIFVIDYLYGAEAGGNVHLSIGYVLFFIWLGLFFYLFSKREAISMKIRLIVRALHHSKPNLSVAFTSIEKMRAF